MSGGAPRLRGVWGACAGLWLGACVEDRVVSPLDVDVSGIVAVDSRVERGDLDLRATLSALGEGTVATWGRGGGRRAAIDHREASQWAVSREGDVLRVDVTTAFVRAGVDVALNLPVDVSVAAAHEWGTVSLDGLRGTHGVRASAVRGRAVEGEGTFEADGDLDLELFPYLDGTVRLFGGDVRLALPAFGPYDLRITAEDSVFDGLVEIAELGWDELQFGEGFVDAWRSPGTVRIDITVRDDVVVEEAR